MEVFEIPAHKSELEVYNDSSKQDILSNLKEARQSSKNGPAFIVDHCKSYFSAICLCDKLTSDIIHFAYEDLHKGMKLLIEDVSSILSNLNDESNDSTRSQYLNILKLYMYCYTQLIITFETKEAEKDMKNLNRKKKKETSSFTIDKKHVIVHLNNLLQLDIKSFWSPPIVEEAFINLISEVCYQFLQNPAVKNERNLLSEIWSFLGTLIKHYNHGKTFIIKIVQFVKMHEHLIYCLPEGFKFLMDNYNCNSMIHEIVQEVTEWQTDEKYQDAQGARFCSTLLVEMAVEMPDMMIPEVFYLTRYLYFDSPTLRNCVLSVITEVILKVLTKHEYTEEEKESRDEFIEILEEHIRDTSPLVRTKVFQHWARLQKEMAIPLKNQNEILRKAVEHLCDKSASARKNAANLVTVFLSHNTYSGDLQLHQRKKDLVAIEAKLKAANAELEAMVSENTENLEEQWKSIEGEIRKLVEEEFEKEPEVEKSEEVNILEVVKVYVEQKDYRNAIKILRTADQEVPAWKDLRAATENISETELVVIFIQSIFVKRRNANIEESYKKYELLSREYEFSNAAVTFLTHIDSARDPMVELLITNTIGDMHAAIEFITTAHQFNIDKSSQGIIDMLRIMQRNEQERKDAIAAAFKTIYLETDSKNLSEHAAIIVNRLIRLLKEIPSNNYTDLQNVIAEWSKKGILDNGVISMLWQYFTEKIPTSIENRIAALEFLRMASISRKSIASKNIKLVSTIALEKKDGKIQENMHLVGIASKFLAVAGMQKIDMNSENPAFKISPDDEIFQSLVEILSVNFCEKIEYYNFAVPYCIDCIYQLCSKPESVCEEVIKRIISSLSAKSGKILAEFQLIRLCQLLGCIAICHLDYMDNTLYKELKRRHNITENRENQKKIKEKKKASKMRDSVLNQSVNLDDSTMEGAQAGDADAEFILNVLEESIVTGSGLLSRLSFIIKNICQRPDMYDNDILQGTAIIALIRYMLVSSKFCEENMQLLFTIFEKTKDTDVKCTILFHCSDLLSRFPNIVEPWTPRFYTSLTDSSDIIRKATFFTLSNLILRDMVRIQGQISFMAKCIIDKNAELNLMSRTFFTQLSNKENNLYNILPDIFSHLVESLNTDDLRTIMKFLFELMKKPKYVENLVERFCCKFEVTPNEEHCRSIVYCLTLIDYNDKGLRKLYENFPKYKHLVHDTEIYGHLKLILSNCSKPQPGKVDLKPLVAEIEQYIESVFEVSDGESRPPPRPVLTTGKKGKKGAAATKNKSSKGRKKKYSSSEYEEESD